MCLFLCLGSMYQVYLQIHISTSLKIHFFKTYYEIKFERKCQFKPSGVKRHAWRGGCSRSSKQLALSSPHCLGQHHPAGQALPAACWPSIRKALHTACSLAHPQIAALLATSILVSTALCSADHPLAGPCQ